MTPLISFFTPTYNRAHTLHRVYEALNKQTFRDFEWIIIDDGSTDNTKEVVDSFIETSDFNIRYYKQENNHKFVTVFKGVELAKGKFFILGDSDDSFDHDSFEKLINYWNNAPKNTAFVSVLAKDENGHIDGNKFPDSEISMSIFDMRYKYKVKGDKWGLSTTEIYKKIPIDLEKYKHKGFIPEGVYQYYFDTFGNHYCINDPLRNYIRDDGDSISLSNTYYSDQNAFGLAENFKTFINVYSNKKWQYPKVVFRNLVGYLIFSSKYNKPYQETIKDIHNFTLRSFARIIYLAKSFLKNVKA